MKAAFVKQMHLIAQRVISLARHLAAAPLATGTALHRMGNSMATLPPKDACLPGRAEGMAVTNEHYVRKGAPIKPPFGEGVETAVFGTGCFWGTEKQYWRTPGVVSTAVGYTAGHTPNPTYREVCSGRACASPAPVVAAARR